MMLKAENFATTVRTSKEYIRNSDDTRLQGILAYLDGIA